MATRAAANAALGRRSSRNAPSSRQTSSCAGRGRRGGGRCGRSLGRRCRRQRRGCRRQQAMAGSTFSFTTGRAARRDSLDPARASRRSPCSRSSQHPCQPHPSCQLDHLPEVRIRAVWSVEHLQFPCTGAVFQTFSGHCWWGCDTRFSPGCVTYAAHPSFARTDEIIFAPYLHSTVVVIPGLHQDEKLFNQNWVKSVVTDFLLCCYRFYRHVIKCHVSPNLLWRRNNGRVLRSRPWVAQPAAPLLSRRIRGIGHASARPTFC